MKEVKKNGGKMITKFTQYNESVRDLLVGPTEEEVLKAYEKMKPSDILFKSIINNNLDGVIYAVEHGANIRNTGEQTLNNAVSFGNYDIVEYLLKMQEQQENII